MMRYKKPIKTFFLCLLVIITKQPLLAQVNLANAGILHISGSTDTLYINGNFTNSGAAGFTNNGRFYVKKDLSNEQASMSVGIGTLYLNGSALQTISGSQIFNTYNLVTNNSAGFILNNSLSVSGTHTFSSGLITGSSTPNYLVYQAGSSYTGDNDSRHVNGWVKKIGATDFIFPVGDASYERTVSTISLSASSEINAKYFTPTTNIFNLFAPLVEVDENEYWQVDKISGGTLKVKMNWDNSKVAFNHVLLTEVTSAQYSGSHWADIGVVTAAMGNVNTTGTITSGAVSTLGPVTFGYYTYPLALQITGFSASRRANSVIVQFAVDNEQGIDHYDIQRSSTSNNFITIDSLAPYNNSLAQLYNFEDVSAPAGILYYRIRALSPGGKSLYSSIVAVTGRVFVAADFSIANPVQTAITVFDKTGRDGTYYYSLFNTAGTQLMQGKVSISSNGSVVLALPPQVAAGIYLFQLNNEQTVYRKKILVEK